VCVQLREYESLYVYVCVRVCVYVPVFVCSHAYARVHLFVCVCVCVCSCMLSVRFYVYMGYLNRSQQVAHEARNAGLKSQLERLVTDNCNITSNTSIADNAGNTGALCGLVCPCPHIAGQGYQHWGDHPPPPPRGNPSKYILLCSSLSCRGSKKRSKL